MRVQKIREVRMCGVNFRGRMHVLKFREFNNVQPNQQCAHAQPNKQRAHAHIVDSVCSHVRIVWYRSAHELI